MRPSRSIIVTFLAFTGSAAAWLACDDDPVVTPLPTTDGGKTGTDSGTPADSGTKTDSGSTGTDSGMGMDSGTDGGEGGAGSSCESYCTTIQANCTGAEEQYKTKDHCLAACADFPTTPTTATSGHSLACRAYHADKAGADGGATTHCPHAGFSGGGVCTEAGDGGDPAGCTAFCTGAVARCGSKFTGGVAACVTDCKTWSLGTPADTSGNTLGCRVYHLNNIYRASDKTAAQATHCPHVAGEAVCK